MPDLPEFRQSVITIVLDHDTGDTSLNTGDLELHTALGLLVAATAIVDERLPEMSFGDNEGDESDDEGDGDE